MPYRRGPVRAKRTAGYRSKYEARVGAAALKADPETKYESERIPYTIEHVYIPDFTLSNGVHVEAKGWFSPEDRRKMLAVKRCNPELDIRFVFQRADRPINRGSKTTCGMWAQKNGFQWAEGLIPLAWFEEENDGMA